jgi:hypothetical protein
MFDSLRLYSSLAWSLKGHTTVGSQESVFFSTKTVDTHKQTTHKRICGCVKKKQMCQKETDMHKRKESNDTGKRSDGTVKRTTQM